MTVIFPRTWSVEKPQQPSMEALLSKWLRDEPHAVSFILDLHRVIELWDDLVDGDKTPGRESVHSAFYAALVTLPRNLFYRQNFVQLSPLVESAIFDWLTANNLEAMGGEHLQSSYILRCSMLTVTVMAAKILGGAAWAVEVNNELRTLGDTFAEYAAKHGVK